MEVRTRKVVHRCFFGDGMKTCGRARVYDHGNFYHTRYPRRSGGVDSPRYRIIEPREPLRSKPRIVNIPERRRSSPLRSEPFKMRLPFVRRMTEPSEDKYEFERRGRDRSSRLFVVDSPEERAGMPRRDLRRSPSPRIRIASPRNPSVSPHIRSISPRTRIPSRSRERDTIEELEIPLREARPRERIKGYRPPRERTPVSEREPLRQRLRQTPVVEVHNSLNDNRERSRSSGRQVRFSSEVEYEKNSNRTRDRYESSQQERSDLGAQTRRSIFPGRTTIGSRIIHDTPTRPRSPPAQNIYRRVGSPWPGRPETPEGNRLQPRIIQDGNREISEAGDRIYAQARRRRGREGFLHDFMSIPGTRPWSRRSTYSGDESTLPGRHRRYRWHWR